MQHKLQACLPACLVDCCIAVLFEIACKVIAFKACHSFLLIGAPVAASILNPNAASSSLQFPSQNCAPRRRFGCHSSTWLIILRLYVLWAHCDARSRLIMSDHEWSWVIMSDHEWSWVFMSDARSWVWSHSITVIYMCYSMHHEPWRMPNLLVTICGYAIICLDF